MRPHLRSSSPTQANLAQQYYRSWWFPHRAIAICLLPAAVAMTALPSSGFQDEATDVAEAKRSATLEGFWPSRNMIRLVVGRFVDEERQRYELTDEQVEQWRDAATKRWTKYADKNRTNLQPLINEFIEMRMEMEPPSTERIQAWATRSEKALGAIRSEMTQHIDEIREILDPLQQAKLETNLLKFNAGFEVAQTKLQQWQRGEYNEREFWDPPASQRRKRREDREAQRLAEEQAKEEAERQKDQILTELDAWDEYVRSFIALYQLDDGQRMTANTSLKEIKERAVKHRDRYKDQIDRLEEMIESNEGDKERLTVIEAKLVELYGPIDEMFDELKDRLGRIPTQQQQTRVAELQNKEPSAEGDDAEQPKISARPPSTDDD